MPKARNRYDRCAQILQWLKSEFPLERLQGIEWKAELMNGNEPCHGWVEERGDKLVICVSKKLCRTKAEAIETVIHEAAHASLWKDGLGYFHGDKFWIRYGRMADAYEHHGWSDSKSYEVE